MVGCRPPVAYTAIMRNIARGQRGFTLVELVVIIAILGVLAAVATPLMVNFLAGAKEEAYNSDLEIIQLAVDAYFVDPSNKRFLGKNQYPLLGRGETNQMNRTVRKESFHHPDNGDPFDPMDEDSKEHRHHRDDDHHDHDHHDHDDGDDHHEHPHHPDWNPLGGIQGANLTTSNGDAPAWTDNKTGTKDGVREIKKDSPDKWTTVKVTLNGVEYFTDARYYFVDVAALVKEGFLKETPKSSSNDNSGAGAGSYTYYLNKIGRVETLPFAFPRTAGFAEGVYP
jgi:prepilin-type N-terminal cleavage/methylation domain-containing protein